MAADAKEDEKYYHVGPVVRVGFMIIATFFAILMVWSMTAELSGAAVLGGVVVPQGKRKTVQHITGGTIQQLFVQEGDFVSEGQPVIKLDETNIRANYDVVRGQYYAAVAQEARLLAEQQELPQIPDVFGPEDSYGQTILRQEIKLFETRRAAYLGQIAILQDRIRQLKEEAQGVQRLREASTRQLALVQQEMESIKELADKGYAPKMKILGYERSIASAQGDVGYRTTELNKTREKIAETENEIQQTKKKQADDINRELRDAQAKINEAEPKLAAAREALNQTIITAPIAGQVINLNIVTVGGVVEAGKPIMDIVPTGREAVIEAQLQPQDIDAVHEGMTANIHISTPGTRTAPTMFGTVESVSRDRITEPRSGTPYYSVRIVLPPEELKKLEPVKLVPGMAAEVAIPIEARTLFDYLVGPLTQRMRGALRER